jgi:hypothetical protein
VNRYTARASGSVKTEMQYSKEWWDHWPHVGSGHAQTTVCGGASSGICDRQSRAPKLAPTRENACWSSNTGVRTLSGEPGREAVGVLGGCRTALKPFLMRPPRFSGLSVDQKSFSRAETPTAPRRALYTLTSSSSWVEGSSTA